MDEIDLKILEELKENSRMTASDISKRVKLSIPAVSERIRKLEEARVIEKYTVRINREKMNYKLLAFMLIVIDKTENIENFRKKIVEFNAVLECHHIAGEYDYLLKVLMEDTKALEYFISNELKQIKGVEKCNTIITFSSLKESIHL